MISNIIVDALVALGLTKNDNLFAEDAKGPKYVVVSATGITDDSPTLPFVHHANINILVSGWSKGAAIALAEDICQTVEAMQGQYNYVVSEALTETYRVDSVVILNRPTFFKMDNKSVVTINLRINYNKTLKRTKVISESFGIAMSINK